MSGAIVKSSGRRPATPKNNHHDYRGPGALLLKAVRAGPDTDWEEEELLDTIHWIRQVLALSCGLVWGLIPLTGLPAVLGFILINLGTVFCWYRVQRLDEELYGGHQALMAEGFAPAVATFLITWILLYSSLH